MTFRVDGFAASDMTPPLRLCLERGFNPDTAWAKLPFEPTRLRDRPYEKVKLVELKLHASRFAFIRRVLTTHTRASLTHALLI